MESVPGYLCTFLESKLPAPKPRKGETVSKTIELWLHSEAQTAGISGDAQPAGVKREAEAGSDRGVQPKAGRQMSTRSPPLLLPETNFALTQS